MRCLLYIALLCIPLGMSAQQLKAKLNPAKAEVGSPVVLDLFVEMDLNSEYLHTPLSNVIPSRLKAEDGETFNQISDQIEIIADFNDSVYTKGNKKYWKGRYTITAWDEGTFLLEAQKIVIDDSTLYFPQLVLTAHLVPVKKKVDMYDIKEKFADVPDPKSKFRIFLEEYWWIIGSILGSLLILILWYRWRNKPEPTKIKVPSLKERTILAIDALDAEKMWEEGKLKEHYIELSYILRSYLSSRYNVSLLENTTKATQLLMRDKGLHEETVQTIGKVLNQSDLVKFAKEAPTELEILKISQMVRQIVAETSPFEFEDAE